MLSKKRHCKFVAGDEEDFRDEEYNIGVLDEILTKARFRLIHMRKTFSIKYINKNKFALINLPKTKNHLSIILLGEANSRRRM